MYDVQAALSVRSLALPAVWGGMDGSEVVTQSFEEANPMKSEDWDALDKTWVAVGQNSGNAA